MSQGKEAVVATALMGFIGDISVGSDEVQMRAVNLTLAVLQPRTRTPCSALKT